MSNILEKLLKKRGIEGIEKLNDDELEQYKGWQKVLSKEKLTVEDIREFCQAQVDMIKARWRKLEPQDERLVVMFTIYSTLIEVIDSPRAEREKLESYLNQLLQN